MIAKTNTFFYFSYLRTLVLLPLFLLITQVNTLSAAAELVAPERYGGYEKNSEASRALFKEAFLAGDIENAQKLLVFNSITPALANMIVVRLADRDWTREQDVIAELVDWMRRQEEQEPQPLRLPYSPTSSRQFIPQTPRSLSPNSPTRARGLIPEAPRRSSPESPTRARGFIPETPRLRVDEAPPTPRGSTTKRFIYQEH